LAISISSDVPLSVHDLDPPEKNYTIENLTDKTHILFFEILGRHADIPNGKQRITVPIVVSPTAKEKKHVSPKQIIEGWKFAYTHWIFANDPKKYRGTPGFPQLELVSIQDTTL
jgi:hypothetical protein